MRRTNWLILPVAMLLAIPGAAQDGPQTSVSNLQTPSRLAGVKEAEARKSLLAPARTVDVSDIGKVQVFPLKVPGVGRVDVFVPVKPPAPDGIATLEIVLLDEEMLTIAAERILLGGQGTMHLEGNVVVTLPSGSQIRGRSADVMPSGPGADGKRRISIQLPRGN